LRAHHDIEDGGQFPHARDERLNSHWFLTLLNARFHLERFRQSDNTDCRSRACWPLTPAEHAGTFAS
jgi:hypothetical protein